MLLKVSYVRMKEICHKRLKVIESFSCSNAEGFALHLWKLDPEIVLVQLIATSY